MRQLIGKSAGYVEQSDFGRVTDLATQVIGGNRISNPEADPLIMEMYRLAQTMSAKTGNMFDTGVDGSDANFIYWQRMLRTLVPTLGVEFNLDASNIDTWVHTLREHQALPEEAIVLMPYFRAAAKTVIEPLATDVPTTGITTDLQLTTHSVEQALTGIREDVEANGHFIAKKAMNDFLIGCPVSTLKVSADAVAPQALNNNHVVLILLTTALHDELVNAANTHIARTGASTNFMAN